MEKIIRPILRQARNYVYRFLDKLPPYVTSRQYLGFDLFYIKGRGIIDRIRFLSPRPIYEEKLCLDIVKRLKQRDNPVFIDIGANIGLISLYVSHHLPHTKIYALEPGLLQRSLFGLTIAKNKLAEKIQLFPYAVSNVSSLTNFITFEHDVDGIADGLVNTGRVPEKSVPIPVETITLDSFIKRYDIDRVDIIKIDIEGAELLAFSGAQEILTKYRPIIFFELNPLNLNNYKHTAEQTISLLKNLNYKIYNLENTECNHNNLTSLMQMDDTFIAVP